MRYVIIGGAGFLGQHLLHLLLNEISSNDQIRIIDKISHLNQSNSIYPENLLDTRIEFFLNTDITDITALPQLLEETDIVFHLASTILYGKKNEKTLQKINVQSIQNIINTAKLKQVKKIIYVSSFATLGCLDDQNKTQLATEECENNWENERFCFYGLSKYHAEQHILQSANEQLEVAVALPGVMLGPGPAHHASRLPFDTVMNRKWVAVPDGGCSYIDVRDVANGLIQLAKQKHASGKYLFVSYHVEHRDLLVEIAKIWKKQIRIFTIPRYYSNWIKNLLNILEWILPKKSCFSREGIIKAFKFRYYSYHKSTNDIGWIPQFGLEQTLEDTYLWVNRKNNA